MKIIPKHHSDKELKIAKAVQGVIEQYKNKIPLLSGTIHIDQYSQPKPFPKLTLNTNYGSARLDNSLLIDLVHLNLYYYVDKTRSIKITLLLNKFKHDFQTNNKLKGEVRKGLKVFVKYLIIVFNEINTVRDLIKPGDFNFIYKHDTKYPILAQWILDNFDRINKTLDENGLVWKNKKQRFKSADIEQEDKILPVEKKKPKIDPVQVLKDLI